jgi:hypothetical protein
VAKSTNFSKKYNLSEAEFQECWTKGILVLDTKSIFRRKRLLEKGVKATLLMFTARGRRL